MSYTKKKSIIGKDCQEDFLPTATNRCFADYGIQMCGISKLYDEYVVYRSYPCFNLMLYTISGAGKVLFPDGTQKQLKADDLLTLPAEVVHYYEIDNSEWQILWLHLDKNVISLETCIKKTLQLPEIQHLLGACLEFMHQTSGKSSMIYSMYAQLILATAKRESNSYSSEKNHETMDRFTQLIREINSQPGKNWTVKKMASKTFYSEGYFYNIFKNIIGMTPMDKVLELRMLRACEYLRSTDYRLNEIAERLGYADQFCFSKAFKRWKGDSPKAFRHIN